MGKPLVVVESPAKARTIGRFLGPEYNVAASVGHVRDLPESAAQIPAAYRDKPWARTAVDVEHGFKPLYVLTPRGREHVRRLKALMKDARVLYLATDEDREGEAIAWHLVEVLKPKIPVKRLVFHEITRRAIERALDTARDIDRALVRAQETRRIVDRLYGYQVSPVLWKKVRPRLSAGRVQSVAVRLVVERERQRIAFTGATWWGVNATFESERGSYEGTLLQLDGRRLATGRDFDPATGRPRSARKPPLLLDRATALSLADQLAGRPGTVEKVERKRFRERPPPPFTTSTLQQEANRKLHWPARRTMSVAQRLYENGWITYMRTDSTTLSDEALRAARELIGRDHGPDFLPKAPRRWKATARNAQEAHEAIRPAGEHFRAPGECSSALGADPARLYDLVWKRTIACQMTDSRGERLSVDTLVDTDSASLLFRSTGRRIIFPGFRRAYVEGADDPEAALADQERLLPPLAPADRVRLAGAEVAEHSTKPPRRLTDATLIKELEARGIGRPSTFATIIETIESRRYVFKQGTALVPTWTAFAVTGLLEDHFTELVDYDFTAQLEQGLDEIAFGKREPLDYLERFYHGSGGRPGLLGLVERATEAADPRQVCSIPLGEHDGRELVARVGRYGPFLAHDGKTCPIPPELPPDELDIERALALLAEVRDGPRVLGTDPDSGKEVALHAGRFGPYVQLGVQQEGSRKRPPRAGLLKGMDPATVDLDTALALLSLPRSLGPGPGDHEITAHNGRYGPFLRCGDQTRSLPGDISPLEVTREQALAILAQPPSRRSRGSTVLAELGTDEEGRAIQLKQGRFGPYVSDGKLNASVPKGRDPMAVQLAEATELLRRRRERPARGRGRRRR